MIKRTFVLITYFITCASYAHQQYSEGSCILLKNQMQEFRSFPHSEQYKSAKQSVDKHCVNPISKEISQHNTVINEKMEKTIASKKAINTLDVSSPSLAHDKKQDNEIKPIAEMTDLVIKVGFWLFIIGFVIALAKALVTLLAKRTAKTLFRKLTDRVEPVIDPNPKEEASVLKQTIAGIVATDLEKDAGKRGEQIVNSIIRNLARKYNATKSQEFRHYQNILLTNDANELTEIDHLIVSPMGIFVIESKNYSGYIFGSQYQAKWTQTLKGQKIQFMNPLRQNYKHCLAVSRLLGVVEGVESLVLFHDKAQFKTKLPPNVRYVSELEEFFNDFTQVKFTSNQLYEFNMRLEKIVSVTSRDDFKEHLCEVKAKFQHAKT